MSMLFCMIWSVFFPHVSFMPNFLDTLLQTYFKRFCLQDFTMIPPFFLPSQPLHYLLEARKSWQPFIHMSMFVKVAHGHMDIIQTRYPRTERNWKWKHHKLLPENLIYLNPFSCVSFSHFTYATLIMFLSHYRYGTGTLTKVFMDRVFQECLTYDSEMDYKTYLDFVLAMENRHEPQSLQYLFRILDINNKGYLDTFCLNYFFRVSITSGNLTYPVPYLHLLRYKIHSKCQILKCWLVTSSLLPQMKWLAWRILQIWWEK